MKRLILLSIIPFLLTCGDKKEANILPLDITISTPSTDDPTTRDSFLSNISKYRLTFSGKFGERKAELLRSIKDQKYRVENIPFDPALRVTVEAIGKGWSRGERSWVENQVLAKGETATPVNWEKGKTESVKIICNLSEVGEDTHEAIFNLYSNK